MLNKGAEANYRFGRRARVSLVFKISVVAGYSGAINRH